MTNKSERLYRMAEFATALDALFLAHFMFLESKV